MSSVRSKYFAELLIEKLEADEYPVVWLDIERKHFGDGERYMRVGVDHWTDLMGKDVIFVGSTGTDEELMEMYQVGCALAGYGTKRRLFIIPFMGYSTMERAVLPGEVVTAKCNLRLLSNIPTVGPNTFLFLDLHVSGLLHYFENSSIRAELYAEEVLISNFKELGIQGDFVFASADMGRPKWVQTFADHFGVEMAFIRKTRSKDVTKVQQVIGDVAGKAVVIYDDMTRSSGTLIKAAHAYLERGATSVFAVLSHFAIPGPEVMRKIEASPITRILVTNSHPSTQLPEVQKSDKVVVVDASGVFTSAVQKLLPQVCVCDQ